LIILSKNPHVPLLLPQYMAIKYWCGQYCEICSNECKTYACTWVHFSFTL